jgi:hypothetical protein
MRLRLRALRRPTSASMKARCSAIVSKSREPRSSSASLIALLRWPCGDSMAPFSCATPRLLRLAVMP